jgi:hypothetical protein
MRIPRCSQAALPKTTMASSGGGVSVILGDGEIHEGVRELPFAIPEWGVDSWFLRRGRGTARVR